MAAIKQLRLIIILYVNFLRFAGNLLSAIISDYDGIYMVST